MQGGFHMTYDKAGLSGGREMLRSSDPSARRRKAFRWFFVTACVLFGMPLIGQSAAQEAACSSAEECLTRSMARNWETYARDIEERWSDLQRARANLQKAEQLGQAALIAQARQFLAVAERRWSYARDAGQAMTSPEVTQTLRDNLVYSERSLTMARSTLERMTALYRGRQSSVGAERDGLTRQLDGLAKDGIRMQREIGLTHLTDMLIKPGEWSLAAIRDPKILVSAFGFVDLSRHLKFMPVLANASGAAASVSLLYGHIDRARNREPPPQDLLEALRPYAEMGQVVMPYLVTAAQTSGRITAGAASVAGHSLLAVQFVGYSLDAARLTQAFWQMDAAQKRLDGVLQDEKSWQKEIVFQGTKVAKLRGEQSRAEDMLRRQAVIAAALLGKE